MEIIKRDFMSESELYELPPNWAWAKFENIANIVGGGTPRRDTPEYYKGGNIPWVTPTDLDSNEIILISKTLENITEKGLKESSTRLLPKGTVLFSSRASIGKIAIANTAITTNQGFANFIPYSILDSKYLAYGLRNFVRSIISLGSGTTFLEVSKSSLKQFSFPLPPLNEQTRIVKKIEDLFRESKTTRQALDKIPYILKKFRQSVLYSAFRGELVQQDLNNESSGKLLEKIRNEKKKKWEEGLKIKGKDPGKFKYKESESVETDNLPELPTGWIWTRAKQVCSKVTDGEHNKPKIYPTGIPMLTAKNVRDGYLDFTNIDYVSEEESIKFLSRCNPEFGDVLVVCVGATTGRTSPVLIDKKFVLGRSVALLKPLQNILETKFLLYFLQSHMGQEQFRSLKKATAQEHIFINQFEDMAVPMTSLKVQARIVSKIDELFSFADQIEKSVEEAKKRADRIDQSILIKAFRGELVPQDPDDEPASVSLERIKQKKLESSIKPSNKKMIKHKSKI